MKESIYDSCRFILFFNGRASVAKRLGEIAGQAGDDEEGPGEEGKGIFPGEV